MWTIKSIIMIGITKVKLLNAMQVILKMKQTNGVGINE